MEKLIENEKLLVEFAKAIYKDVEKTINNENTNDNTNKGQIINYKLF